MSKLYFLSVNSSFYVLLMKKSVLPTAYLLDASNVLHLMNDSFFWNESGIIREIISRLVLE